MNDKLLNANYRNSHLKEAENIYIEEITNWRIYKSDLKQGNNLKSELSQTHTSLSQQETFRHLLNEHYELIKLKSELEQLKKQLIKQSNV